MRVLFLDDDAYRHDCFARRLPDEEIRHVHGHDEALTALSTTRFDVVYLDHDLEDFRAVEPSELNKTGLDVARFIAGSVAAELRPAKVVVHSWNESGARQMAEILRTAGIPVLLEPFVEDD
ncbi:MAG: hypothetical protein HY901_33995 [Deltaproteobacteria bacterium]|nr:hypothetical protein [Deltaproteobacteria bacterium]